LRNHPKPRLQIVLGALALSALALALSLSWSVPAAFAAGPGNPEATELVRLINGERAHLGKPALRTDTFLAAKARDGAVTCPNDATKVMAGRAKDFAVYGFGSNAHALRLCPTYTSMDAMKLWGYRGARGEIAALNGGYGTAKVGYAYGCSPSVRTCPGPSTSTYSTTAHAMLNWTSSPGHYSIIVGAYDRVGCGAWVGSNGAFYYDCMFSRGGRAAARSAAKSGGGAAPAASAAASDVLLSSDPGLPGAEMAIPPAAPTTLAQAIQGAQATAAAPPDQNAALARTGKGGPQSDPPGGNVSAPALSRNLSVAAGAITAICSLFYGLFLAVKRRRQTGRPTS
jgi:hypothetical protein